MRKNEIENRKKLLQLDAEELLQNSELIELRGGNGGEDAMDAEPTGNCHGNGCNSTCKKKQ